MLLYVHNIWSYSMYCCSIYGVALHDTLFGVTLCTLTLYVDKSADNACSM